MFGVSTLDLMNLPRADNGQIDYSADFFGKRAHLTVSGQLEAEIFALAFTNVYTFGPTFRAENSNTPRHLAEFWMIEPEMAFCDLDGNRQLAEQFLKYIISHVLNTCGPDLAFFNQRIDNTVLETLEQVATADFEHITYTEAVSILEKSGRAFEFPVFWGADLQSEHERYLTEETFKKPVVVTDYPKEIKAFYMRLNDDEKPSARWMSSLRASARSSADPSARSATTFSSTRYANKVCPRKNTGGIWNCVNTARSRTQASALAWNGC
jgi:asparaginyl-tRNA synthetase